MNVQILNFEVETVSTGKRPYKKGMVTYKGDYGLKQQNILDFANPTLFKQLPDLVGKRVEVDQFKNDKGYNEWRSVKEAGEGGSTPSTPASTGSVSTFKSDRETPEERAKRQVMIVKQSSLDRAVSTLSVGAKAPPDRNEVVNLAQFYTDWILEEPVVENEFDDLPQ